MASTTMTKITVERLTPYGFAAGGAYINYSKQFNEADKAKVVPGASFDAEVYVADSGKQYLNKILGNMSVSAVAAPSGVSVTPAPAASVKTFKPKYQKKEDSGMSKEEWAAKDVRISRQGCIQAAVNALGPVMVGDGLFEAAKVLADQMLDYVNSK